MEYRKIGDNYYIRMDRGDEIISNLLEICEKESIPSAVFSGIGGCQSAELQVFIPERLRVGERSSWTSQAAEPSAGMTGSFETEQLEGMLELVSLNGNVVRDDDGKQFDSSRGGVPLACRLCDLIEGWIIAIQQMHIGDKWEIYIPAEMGYGKFSQPGIPGGSTLIFEIELLGIA